MTFYALRFSKAPRIRFACSAEVLPGIHHNIIDRRNHLLELCFHTCEEAHFITEDDIFMIGRDEFMVILPDIRYDVMMCSKPKTAESDAAAAVISVAAEIDDLQYTVYRTEDIWQIHTLLQNAEQDTIFLPCVWRPDEVEFQEMTMLIYGIINHFAAGKTLLCLSDWYRVLAMLDEAFQREIAQLGQKMPQTGEGSAYYYVRKAKKYICSNYDKRLTLTDIAQELGISKGYLCTIFKNGTGQTVIDYINLIRMQHIRSKLYKGDKRYFSVICAESGVHDIRYAQRMFKKYFGISMQRCRQIENGISLYHTNPWTVTDVDHDIYKDEESRGYHKIDISV